MYALLDFCSTYEPLFNKIDVVSFVVFTKGTVNAYTQLTPADRFSSTGNVCEFLIYTIHHHIRIRNAQLHVYLKTSKIETIPTNTKSVV